jgi:hypothetical protein
MINPNRAAIRPERGSEMIKGMPSFPVRRAEE